MIARKNYGSACKQDAKDGRDCLRFKKALATKGGMAIKSFNFFAAMREIILKQDIKKGLKENPFKPFMNSYLLSNAGT
jgi:hypothetical protein